jgi:hypothetical protein
MIRHGDLVEALKERRGMLELLAPRCLDESARTRLINNILDPDMLHGIAARMICAAIADYLNGMLTPIVLSHAEQAKTEGESC